MKIISIKDLGILAGILMIAISSCTKIQADSNKADEMKSEIKENYATIVFENYSDALSTAQDLDAAIDAFIAAPTDANLTAAKTAWLASREPYGQSEVFRFADGPIDDADGPEGLLNAWPCDESYIDYVEGNTTSGIINDLTNFPTITKDILDGLNEEGGEENVSVGYHAIEFLLWGQDDANTSTLEAGKRSYTDYTTAANADRRKSYLGYTSDLLVDHLQTLVDEWDPSKSDNYRAEFIALENDVALKNMMSGMGILSKSELAGERIFTALDNQDQEDEHSCFSDNTHRDIILNAKGIQNVYLGTYNKVDGSTIEGTSLKDLLERVDKNLAEELTTLNTEAQTAVEAIPVPFDNALTEEEAGGTGPIMSSVTSLQSQGDKITAMATALGITISTALPE